MVAFTVKRFFVETIGSIIGTLFGDLIHIEKGKLPTDSGDAVCTAAKRYLVDTEAAILKGELPKADKSLRAAKALVDACPSIRVSVLEISAVLRAKQYARLPSWKPSKVTMRAWCQDDADAALAVAPASNRALAARAVCYA
jgi:hypothetical protein